MCAPNPLKTGPHFMHILLHVGGEACNPLPVCLELLKAERLGSSLLGRPLLGGHTGCCIGVQLLVYMIAQQIAVCIRH